METIQIAKAGGVAGKAPDDLTITFSGEPPAFDKLPWPEAKEKSDAWFESQAITLGEALLRTLPGGTIDRFICFLLRQKASYFVVPHVQSPKE